MTSTSPSSSWAATLDSVSASVAAMSWQGMTTLTRGAAPPCGGEAQRHLVVHAAHGEADEGLEVKAPARQQRRA